MDKEYVTKERFNKIIDNICVLTNSVNDLRVDVARLPEKILDKGDKRFAAIWAATAWKFVIATAGGSVILLMLSLIIEKN